MNPLTTDLKCSSELKQPTSDPCPGIISFQLSFLCIRGCVCLCAEVPEAVKAKACLQHTGGLLATPSQPPSEGHLDPYSIGNLLPSVSFCETFRVSPDCPRDCGKARTAVIIPAGTCTLTGQDGAFAQLTELAELVENNGLYRGGNPQCQ